MTFEYVHRKSIGNRELCEVECSSLANKLRSEYSFGRIDGFQTLLVADQECAENNSIFSNYNGVTEGRFPFLFAAVNPNGNDTEIRTLMALRGYTELLVEQC
ncbi:hypothetical protein CMI42_05960 [Candidatus Pacearchaeota archaeon]|nr:hypothetical protein [Candidatus Pacearchaeota archaeon]